MGLGRPHILHPETPTHTTSISSLTRMWMPLHDAPRLDRRVITETIFASLAVTGRRDTGTDSGTVHGVSGIDVMMDEAGAIDGSLADWAAGADVA